MLKVENRNICANYLHKLKEKKYVRKKTKYFQIA